MFSGTIRKGLENISSQEISELSFLHIVCSTPDVRSLYLRRNDEWVEETLDQHRDNLLIDIPSPWEDEYEWFLSDLKTALLICLLSCLKSITVKYPKSLCRS